MQQAETTVRAFADQRQVAQIESSGQERCEVNRQGRLDPGQVGRGQRRGQGDVKPEGVHHMRVPPFGEVAGKPGRQPGGAAPV